MLQFSSNDSEEDAELDVGPLFAGLLKIAHDFLDFIGGKDVATLGGDEQGGWQVGIHCLQALGYVENHKCFSGGYFFHASY